MANAKKLSGFLLDVGANSACFSWANIRRFGFKKVVCVDPCRHVHNRLATNAKIAKEHFGVDMTFLPLAISDTSGQEVQFFESNCAALSTLHSEWLKSTRFPEGVNMTDTYSVQTITLDVIIQRFGVPDLLKIDVEGHEEQALLGLHSKVPLLCFEWCVESSQTVKRILDRLHQDLQFAEVHIQFSDKYTYRPPSTEWVPISTFDANCLSQGSSTYGMAWVR